MRVLVYVGTWRSTCYMIFVLKTCGLAKPQNELWGVAVQRKKKKQQDSSKVTSGRRFVYLFDFFSSPVSYVSNILHFLCKTAVLNHHSKVLYLLWLQILAGDFGIRLVGIYNLSKCLRS